MRIELTEELANELWLEEEVEVEGVTYAVQDITNWEDDFKYQSCQVIFSESPSDESPHYSMGVSRTGSFYTDYNYEFSLSCPEVIRQEKSSYEWVVKNVR